MNADRALILAIEQSERSVLRARDLLRNFNDPEWRDTTEGILRQIDEIILKNKSRLDDSLPRDFSNIVGVINQISWPIGDEGGDVDSRIADLRSAIGSLRMDIDEVFSRATRAGICKAGEFRPDAVDVAKVDRIRESWAIDCLLERAKALEVSVNEGLIKSASSGLPIEQAIAESFAGRVHLEVGVIRLAASVGDTTDLAVIERATSSIVRNTELLLGTVMAQASRASETFKAASRVVATQARRLASGVATVVRRLLAPPQPRRVEEQEKIEAVPMGTVGAFLRQHREQQGLDIVDISTRTRVGVSQLERIESGNFAEFASSHYVIGFVDLYAAALGLNRIEARTIARQEYISNWSKEPWITDPWRLSMAKMYNDLYRSRWSHRRYGVK